MEDEHKRSGMMTREEWMAWLRETWDKAQKIAASRGEELHPINHTLEPVAYITGFHNGHCVIQPTDPTLVLPVGMALYRAPTEWVGLTEIEICDIEADELTSANSETFSFARAIEVKLKEKNT